MQNVICDSASDGARLRIHAQTFRKSASVCGTLFIVPMILPDFYDPCKYKTIISGSCEKSRLIKR